MVAVAGRFCLTQRKLRKGMKFFESILIEVKLAVFSNFQMNSDMSKILLNTRHACLEPPSPSHPTNLKMCGLNTQCVLGYLKGSIGKYSLV